MVTFGLIIQISMMLAGLVGLLPMVTSGSGVKAGRVGDDAALTRLPENAT